MTSATATMSAPTAIHSSVSIPCSSFRCLSIVLVRFLVVPRRLDRPPPGPTTRCVIRAVASSSLGVDLRDDLVDDALQTALQRAGVDDQRDRNDHRAPRDQRAHPDPLQRLNALLVLQVSEVLLHSAFLLCSPHVREACDALHST